MSDLIERDKAIDAIKKLPNAGTRWIVSAESVFEVLMQLPSARPKEGKWFHYEGMLYCSECHTEIYKDIMEYLGDDVPKFCPNCGADMREREGE